MGDVRAEIGYGSTTVGFVGSCWGRVGHCLKSLGLTELDGSDGAGGVLSSVVLHVAFA